MHRNRRVGAATAGRHRDEVAAGEQRPDVVLRVGRGEPGIVGQHPHLHEPHRRAGGDVVVLGVPDPAAGAQPLRQAGHDHAAVALGVLVAQPAVEHPGDDLEVAVRVGVVAGAGLDPVVVVRDQDGVPDVGGVVVRAEREGVPGDEAVGAGGGTALRPSHLDRHTVIVPAGQRGSATTVVRRRSRFAT